MLEDFKAFKFERTGCAEAEVTQFNGDMAICCDDAGPVIITEEQAARFFGERSRVDLLLRLNQSGGMRESFRKAASDLAIEAGIIATPVKHDEVAESVLQDVYFLQLLAEVQLRMQRLSVRYEKLRSAAVVVSESSHSVSEMAVAMKRLTEELA